jgi:hypothetical protein
MDFKIFSVKIVRLKKIILWEMGISNIFLATLVIKRFLDQSSADVFDTNGNSV